MDKIAEIRHRVWTHETDGADVEFLLELLGYPYRLRPLYAQMIHKDEWRIGLEDAIVSGTVRRLKDTSRGPKPFELTLLSEVACGMKREGTEPHLVASLEEAVALVEAARLEAFKYDIEPVGANPAPNDPPV